MRITTSFLHVDKDNIIVQDEDGGDYGDIVYDKDEDGDDAFLQLKQFKEYLDSFIQVEPAPK